MRKLFKNSFLSFLGSKLAMILLSLTVFLSIAIFTMLSSTSWAFDSSYNQVISNGKLHDFTVNEKYTIQGQAGLEYKGPAKVETIYEMDDTKVKNDEWNPVNDDFRKLFSVTKKDTTIANSVAQTINPWIKINFNKDTKFITDPLDPTKIESIKGGFKIQISEDNAPKQTSTLIYVNDEIVINDQVKSTTIVTKTQGNNEYKISFSKDYKELERFLIDKIISPNALATPTTKLRIGLDVEWNTMTGDYKQTLQSSVDPKQNDQNIQRIFQAHGIDDVLIDYKGTWNPKNQIDITKFTIDEQKKLKQMKNVAQTALDEYVSKSRTREFIKETQQKYGQYIAKNGIKSIESIYINSGKQQFKMVNTNDNQEEVDKLVLFKGHQPEKSMDVASMQNTFEDYLKKSNITFSANEIQSSKEYKIVFDNNLGVTASFVDPSAYQVVITDGYAKFHNVLPISQSDLKVFNKEVLKFGLNTTKINSLFKDSRFKEHVQYIDSTPYIVTGIGTTPDFSFPIINQQNPLPNSKTQAILFTNDHGYKRIADAFRGNQKEDYLAYKLKSGITDKEKAAVINGISNIASKMMSWGNSINPVSEAFDTNEKIILAPQRIAFLKKLKQSITTIAFLTTTFLAILTAFIILMVIKKQISGKRKILGTLLANGYTKHQIAGSMTSIALIIIVVPAILGYIAGHFMQSVFIDMFTNYWTLPIYNDSFSWITLLLVVLFPTIIVAVFAYIVSRTALKGNLISILNSSQSKSAGWITSKVLKPFAWLGVKSKITISLFTSNLSKMALVCVTTAIAMVAGGIAFSIMGRFNYALNTSKEKVNYTFKVDMASPTYEGGLMGRINPDQFGMADDSKNWNTTNPKEIFKEGMKNSTELKDTRSYFHVPGKSDGTDRWDVDYLRNRMQFKSMLNFEVGNGSGTGINPWKSALALMPENQRNIANKQEKEFVETILNWMNDIQVQKLFTSQEWSDIRKFTDEAKKNDYEFDSTQINDANKDLYRKFIFEALKEQIKRYDNKLPYKLPYFISYNNITTDNDDEVYTHIDIDYVGTNLLNKSEVIQTTITGIDPNTKMIKFDNGLMDKFKKFKYDVTRDNDQIVPLVINTYFQEAYGLEEGQIIDFTIKNRADRFNTTTPATGKGMIIGIQESYDGPKIYTTKSIANAKLGWTDPENNKNAFNGVYTKRTDPMIFKNISLYSVSGISPGTDTIDSQSEQDLKDNIRNKVSVGYVNPRVVDLPTYLKVYSNSPYISTFSSADWAAMSNYAFTNILDLSGKMIWMVEAIAIFIAILFVAIIASMIISDNKKFISTMKVLGYRDREIRKMFFRSLIPAILIGLLIAIPITFGALLMMKAVIISFGAILVPIHMMGWELILTFFLITSAFSIIYYVSMRKLGNEEMLEAFKE